MVAIGLVTSTRKPFECLKKRTGYRGQEGSCPCAPPSGVFGYVRRSDSSSNLALSTKLNTDALACDAIIRTARFYRSQEVLRRESPATAT